MRALLLIPDPSSRRRLEGALVQRGWTVVVRDPERSVPESMRSDAPSLVVVQETPAGVGSDTCRFVRSEVALRGCYVLGVVWQNDVAAIQRLATAGADDVIAAPFEGGEIDTALTLAEVRIGGSPAGGGGNGFSAERSLSEITRQLHVQQAFLEGLFENAPEGVVILDEEHCVVRINSEFTRVFGYTPDEAQGRKLNDLIVPEPLHGESIELDGGLVRGERVLIETVRQHRDGHLIDVSVLATPIHVNGPVGAFVIYRDITERKRQEAALRASEARYRALFDQSPVGVFLCDQDLKISHCNEYLMRIIGAPYDEIVGSDLLSLREGKLLPGLRAALRGEPAFYEGAYRTHTGKQLFVSVHYAPLRDEDGSVIGGIGVLEDISHRILTEKRLRAQAAEMERMNAALRERTLELEAAMKARNRLYSAMNHELRTPISAILLYQELLLAGSLGALADEQQRALEHSHTATRHLLNLVRDILDLSKIEAGKVSVQPVEVRLDQLLAELHASMAPLTESYGSLLYLDAPEEMDPIVTDPQRLRQILMNFVSNAAKYGNQNPIVLRCSIRESNEVDIEVIDRGIGIAREDLENVFEDFVQLNTVDEEGTGLGLAISKRLADLLSARVEVESAPGEGSTFRIILPTVTSGEEPASAEPLAGSLLS